MKNENIEEMDLFLDFYQAPMAKPRRYGTPKQTNYFKEK